jgi:hypothetical protein
MHIRADVCKLLISAHVQADIIKLLISAHIRADIIKLLISMHIRADICKLLISAHIRADIIKLLISAHIRAGPPSTWSRPWSRRSFAGGPGQICQNFHCFETGFRQPVGCGGCRRQTDDALCL